MEKYLTKEGLSRLKDELNNLETKKRKEVAEKLREAASYGDLKENAAYDAAKEEQGIIEGKIRELKDIISQAKIINSQTQEKIGIGSFVILESKDGKEKFQIVGPEEVNILNNKISFQSPLGESLLDKKKHDLIEIETPSGRLKYKIIDIQ